MQIISDPTGFRSTTFVISSMTLITVLCVLSIVSAMLLILRSFDVCDICVARDVLISVADTDYLYSYSDRTFHFGAALDPTI
jgi:hypothetical protein